MGCVMDTFCVQRQYKTKPLIFFSKIKGLICEELYTLDVGESLITSPTL